MPALTILTGEGCGQLYEFDKEVVVGRSPEADFVLKDLRASRKHARVFSQGSLYYIEDLNSQNGTFLNGKRISVRLPLKPNDNIRIGITWLGFSGAEEIAPGYSFSGFEVLQEIRRNQSGTLYLARQKALVRDVLLWVLSGECWEQEQPIVRENFFRQISNIAGLFHRNILMLLDFGANSGYLYCAFEKVQIPETVNTVLQAHTRMEIDQALDIAKQVAQGMAYAHSQNVLHLHLTPDNILVQTNPTSRVVITEFGFSRFLSQASSNQTTTTGILGISDYIAPEQIRTDYPESTATDVYSFGCLVYHLLAHRPPFLANSPYELANQHVEQKPISLAHWQPEVPAEVATMVARCMEKKPSDRFSSFGEILSILENAQELRATQQILQSPLVAECLKEELGERTLWRWWVLLPLLSLALLGLVYRLTQSP